MTTLYRTTLETPVTREAARLAAQQANGAVRGLADGTVRFYADHLRVDRDAQDVVVDSFLLMETSGLEHLDRKILEAAALTSAPFIRFVVSSAGETRR